MLKMTRLTDAERVDVLPRAIGYLATQYNWDAATPCITRAAIDLYVNERPGVRRSVLLARRAERRSGRGGGGGPGD